MVIIRINLRITKVAIPVIIYEEQQPILVKFLFSLKSKQSQKFYFLDKIKEWCSYQMRSSCQGLLYLGSNFVTFNFNKQEIIDLHINKNSGNLPETVCRGGSLVDMVERKVFKAGKNSRGENHLKWYGVYSLPIISQKCAGMGVNGFIFKKIIKNSNIIEKKIMGAV